MADLVNPHPAYPAFRPARRGEHPRMDCPACGCVREVTSTDETYQPAKLIAVLACDHTIRIEPTRYGPLVSWDEAHVIRPGDRPWLPLRDV